jgi:hypothetical protein
MQAEMQLQTETPVEVQTETSIEKPEVDTRPRWHLAKKIAFRFTFSYFLLYTLPFPLQYIPYLGGYAAQYYFRLWQALVPWVGNKILGISYEIPTAMTGSGDKTFDWVQAFCFLTLAATATVIWSVLDRKRINYQRLHQWFTLHMRFVLASWMIIYGTMKAIPTQMPRPPLTRLLEQFGDFSPMGVLWYSTGSSPVYTSITGSVELLGGILLIFPRTALMGSIVSLFAMIQVFILNMCYDVPVKLFSFHLILMSVFLLAPHLQRITNVLLLNRQTEPAPVRPWFQRTWLNRSLLVFQIVFGLYMVGFYLYNSYQGYNTYGGGAPKPPYYGIWAVEDFTVNGQVKPPLITDETRWQRVIIQTQNGITIQPMRGPNQGYRLQLNQENKTMTLGKGTDQEWKADFTFEEPEAGQLKMVGVIDGNRTEARLVRFDETQFLLNSRGFHWIQERPFNR